jgi:hypothetical protein
MVTQPPDTDNASLALAATPGAQPCDPVVSAILDHLAHIAAHQDEIHAHQHAIVAALTLLHTLVEERLP